MVKRLLASFSVAVIISGIVFLLLNDFGITWDEPVYVKRAGEYMDWIKHPTSTDRDRIFGAETGDIHPPLRKLVGGITHEILTNRLKKS